MKNRCFWIIVAALTACDSSPDSPETLAAKEKVLAQFKGPDEATARDAIWTSRTMFKVAVVDDGASRNGYAEYVCAELRSNGLSNGFTVEIVDFSSVARGESWKELGTARCR